MLNNMTEENTVEEGVEETPAAEEEAE